MDARTSYFSHEIKDLHFKFKSLRNDHEKLKKEHEELQKQVKTLKEEKWGSQTILKWGWCYVKTNQQKHRNISCLRWKTRTYSINLLKLLVVTKYQRRRLNDRVSTRSYGIIYFLWFY